MSKPTNQPPDSPAPTRVAGTTDALYILRLYVTGPTSVSARAVVNARQICEAHLRGRYQLEILNVADNVALATKDQVIAAPTLIRLAPLPLKRFIGDMSNTERLIQGLDVSPSTTH